MDFLSLLPGKPLKRIKMLIERLLKTLSLTLNKQIDAHIPRGAFNSNCSSLMAFSEALCREFSLAFSFVVGDSLLIIKISTLTINTLNRRVHFMELLPQFNGGATILIINHHVDIGVFYLH